MWTGKVTDGGWPLFTLLLDGTFLLVTHTGPEEQKAAGQSTGKIDN